MHINNGCTQNQVRFSKVAKTYTNSFSVHFLLVICSYFVILQNYLLTITVQKRVRPHNYLQTLLILLWAGTSRWVTLKEGLIINFIKLHNDKMRIVTSNILQWTYYWDNFHVCRTCTKCTYTINHKTDIIFVIYRFICNMCKTNKKCQLHRKIILDTFPIYTKSINAYILGCYI